MNTDRRNKILKGLSRLYSPYKVKEVKKILSRSDWQDKVQEYIRAKAKVDVTKASESSNKISTRCVAYLVNNPNNEIVLFFINNPQYKPAGLTTTVQLAYLYATDWKDYSNELIQILYTAKDTKIAERRTMLNDAGMINSPLLFLEYLLNTKLDLSLIKTRSKFYNGYKIKNTDVYDKSANNEADIS